MVASRSCQACGKCPATFAITVSCSRPSVILLAPTPGSDLDSRPEELWDSGVPPRLPFRVRGAHPPRGRWWPVPVRRASEKPDYLLRCVRRFGVLVRGGWRAGLGPNPRRDRQGDRFGTLPFLLLLLLRVLRFADGAGGVQDHRWSRRRSHSQDIRSRSNPQCLRMPPIAGAFFAMLS